MSENLFLIQIQVQGLKLDDFARGKLDITTKELLEEKEEAMAVCNADWLSDSKLWWGDWDAFLDDCNQSNTWVSSIISLRLISSVTFRLIYFIRAF